MHAAFRWRLSNQRGAGTPSIPKTRSKKKLEASLLRGVVSVRVAVLRGHTVECPNIESAISYLVEEARTHRVREDAEEREMFEIVVRFTNAARIEATFPTREEAITF